MISEKDIIDTVYDVLAENNTVVAGKTSAFKSGFFTKEKWIKSYSSLESKKKLITESDVKAAVKNGAGNLKIPKDAIIGPLALEIIQEKGIKLIRE